MKKRFFLIAAISCVALLFLSKYIFALISDFSTEGSMRDYYMKGASVDGVRQRVFLNDGRMFFIRENWFLKNTVYECKSGKMRRIKFIGESRRCFVEDDKLYYVTNDAQLVREDLLNGEVETFADKVVDFMCHNDIIYFINTDGKRRFLKKIDIENRNTEHLIDDINWFTIQNDRLVYFTYSYWLLFEENNNNRPQKQFGTIDLATRERKIISDKQLELYPKLLHNSLVILDDEWGPLSIWDTETAEERILYEHDFDEGVSCASNDDFAYVSSINPFRSPYLFNREWNGLWKIDWKTKEKHKISKKIYSDLYALDDGKLIGYRDGKFYEIQENGKRKRIF